MSLILMFARILLAAIFAVASLTKLADLTGSRQAMRDFGIPTFLAGSFGVLLPLAELAVAIALIPTTSAWYGALGALVLVLLFIAGISYNLARGRTPDCHCFGQLHSAPAGWPTMIRNLILAASAGFVVSFQQQYARENPISWLGTLPVFQLFALLVAVALLSLLIGEGWILLQMLGQQGRLILRIEAMETQLVSDSIAPQPVQTGDTAPPAIGLPIGTKAPSFALSNLNGEITSLDALLSLNKPLVLIFSDPGCGPCTALLPEIECWQREHAAKLVVALISRGTVEANRPKVTEHGMTHVLLQKEREVAETYQAYGTPSAVLVRRDGTIGSPVAPGADAIRQLITNALNPPVLNVLPMAVPANGHGHGAAPAPERPPNPKVGEAAPEFTLPDLTGKPVSLSDFRGSKTLILFWNPGCGFCQRMLDDLKSWEIKPPKGAPRLLVVSTGSAENNEAMDLKSTVVLDQGFGIGSKFGANGTPMGVLVDAEGKIASEVAAGAQAVLALAESSQEQAKSVTV